MCVAFLGSSYRWVDLASLPEVDRRAAFINIYNSLIVHAMAVGPMCVPPTHTHLHPLQHAHTASFPPCSVAAVALRPCECV